MEGKEDEGAWTNCIKIGHSGKLIRSKKKDLFSRKWYQTINFQGKIIFIQ